MRNLATALFATGVLLLTLTPFEDQAGPRVLRLIAPGYLNATNGLKRLDSNSPLEPDHVGFDELDGLFREALRAENPAEAISQIEITKFTKETPATAFTNSGAGYGSALRVTMSNGQTLVWNAGAARAAVNGLKEARVLRYALLVLLAAVVAQIVGLVLERASTVPELDTLVLAPPPLPPPVGSPSADTSSDEGKSA